MRIHRLSSLRALSIFIPMMHAKAHTMNPLPHDLRLPARTMHSIADVAGLQLRCSEGTLWLTLDNDPRDVILEAGESFVGTEHRHGIVYALKDARLSVSASAVRAEVARPTFWRTAQHA
jgi:hypothetical protein